MFCYKYQDSNFKLDNSSSGFLWPLDNNLKTITSYFGYRNAPTSGASTYHSGIDIAAPEGSPIYSIFTGKVIFSGFKGAGGYSITVQNDDFMVSYCHCSPNFLVPLNSTVLAGMQIATVGPKYVYDVPNNPYKDSSGNPTNGATTGCHLHLTLKKGGSAINPLDYVNY